MNVNQWGSTMVTKSITLRNILPAALVAAGMGLTGITAADAASFSYSYGNPYDANADDYIHSTSNVHLYTEGSVRMWIPKTGGSSLATTTPGVITYKFDFGTEVVDTAFLRTNNPTFHWNYSQGHNYFYGSKDGTNWEQLLDVPPPAYGKANGGVFSGMLPDTLLGGNQLWFKAELYSYGSNVGCCGDAGRNTAQHSRWGGSGDAFKLDVDYRQPDVIPLPAAIPLLGSGLAFFGFVGWRKKRRS